MRNHTGTAAASSCRGGPAQGLSPWRTLWLFHSWNGAWGTGIVPDSWITAVLISLKLCPKEVQQEGWGSVPPHCH